MIEVYNDNFSIKDNYNIKDNTIMDNEDNTIKTEQLGFDSGTKANTNNIDTEQGTPLFSAIMKADPTLASDAKKMDAENEKTRHHAPRKRRSWRSSTNCAEGSGEAIF